MTENSIRSISPDGITGMIFAMEGMQDTIVLLNGPMGCRFYHSSTSGFLMRRPLLYLPSGESGERVPVDYNYLNDWFFRQERVPCTYLDGYDYVYGTGEKAAEALQYISDNIDFSILAIVNSPGAALIGDDLYGIAKKAVPNKPIVYLESPGYSVSFEEGYAKASLEMLKIMLKEAKKEGVDQGKADQAQAEKQNNVPGNEADRRPVVNLLGLSVWHRYCEGDLRELRRLFDLCGIDVGAALCADCSAEELRSVPGADLNVVLYPQAGLASAEFLKERFQTPYYVCDTLPVGFSATEKMFSEISGILGTSDLKLKEESERARALAWLKINGIYQMYGKPKGIGFHVEASETLKKAYTAFLKDYLGMEPESFYNAELLFSDANRISERALKNDDFCGIEIALPGMGYTDLTVKTHMGIEGALFLTEQVLNGIMSK